MPQSKDSQGRWWEIVVQASGSMDCGFACAAMVSRYYHGGNTQTAMDQAKSEFGLGGVTFNETAGWDQTKQNSLLQSLAAQGYNAFGVFGVSPDNINSTFSDLTGKHLFVASLGSCPAGTTDAANFCLATDVETAAYQAAKTAIDQMGGSGNLVHLTGNKTDSNTQRRISGQSGSPIVSPSFKAKPFLSRCGCSWLAWPTVRWKRPGSWVGSSICRA